MEPYEIILVATSWFATGAICAAGMSPKHRWVGSVGRRRRVLALAFLFGFLTFFCCLCAAAGQFFTDTTPIHPTRGHK